MIYKPKLTKKQWETDDTCPECFHQGMAFKADQMEDDGVFAGMRAWRIDGVLYCQKCGWFDDLQFIYDYQVPENCIRQVENKEE